MNLDDSMPVGTPARVGADSPGGDADAHGLPIARPVLGVIDAGDTRTLLSGDPFLLGGLSRLDALVDLVALAVGLLVVELTTVPLIAAWKGISLDQLEHAQAQSVIVTTVIVVRAIMAAGIVATLLWVRRQRLAHVGLSTKALPLNIGIGFATAIAVFLIGAIASLTAQALFPSLTDEMQENIDRLDALLPRFSTVEALGFMSVVGAYEELVFRGFLLPRLRRLLGAWVWAVLVSTAIFAALHLPNQVSVAVGAIVGLSLAFSAVTIWRRSIIPAIIPHALFNFVQLVLLNSLPRDVGQ